MIRKELNEAFSKRLCGVEKTPTATPGTTPRHSSSSGGSSGDGTIRERRPLPPVPLPLWNHGSITRNEGIRRIENGQVITKTLNINNTLKYKLFFLIFILSHFVFLGGNLFIQKFR